MQSRTYDPALLPAVEKVVILNLGGNLKGAMSKYVSLGQFSIRPASSFPIYATVVVENSEASALSDLWRELPQGEQMRCHIPPYGLRFYKGGQMIVEASICWQCNNIWARSDDVDSVYTFDSSARISRRLLEMLHEMAERNPPATRRLP